VSPGRRVSVSIGTTVLVKWEVLSPGRRVSVSIGTTVLVKL
jgi:hypothetical protein